MRRLRSHQDIPANFLRVATEPKVRFGSFRGTLDYEMRIQIRVLAGGGLE